MVGEIFREIGNLWYHKVHESGIMYKIAFLDNFINESQVFGLKIIIKDVWEKHYADYDL